MELIPDGSKMEKLNVAPYSMESKGIRLKNTDWKQDIKDKTYNFKPDLIAISSTEDMWELGMKVLSEIKDYKIKNNVPVIAGGVFPTFAPDLCIKEELVDIVCVGEGENAMIDLCKKIKNNQNYDDVTNCWVKTIGPEYLKNRNVIKKIQ